MDFRLTILLCLLIAVIVTAQPAAYETRMKRDVMETMTNAWNQMVRTMSDAGDAIVHVFRPTEKSVLTKMTDEVKSLTQ